MLKRLAIVMIVIFLTACSGMEIRSDYDPKANFDGLKTYAWLPEPKTKDPRIDNAIVVKRITTAIDGALAAKGYQKTVDNPDFLVGYHAAVESKTDVQVMNNYYGYGPGWGWNYYDPVSVHAYEYEQGTLMIDIVEPGKKQLIWRGSAKAVLNPLKTLEERDKRVRAAADQILAAFPPTKKAKK